MASFWVFFADNRLNWSKLSSLEIELYIQMKQCVYVSLLRIDLKKQCVSFSKLWQSYEAVRLRSLLMTGHISTLCSGSV